MKKVLLAVFVLVGLVPFVSPAWGVSLNDAHDRYLDKRDMNFGQRRELEEKVEDKTQEAREQDQNAEMDEDAFKTLYEARKATT